MTEAKSPFSSIDETLGQIKADHAHALRTIEDRNLALGLELKLANEAAKVAVEKRIEAEQRTAALQALFAIVRHALDEAEAMDVRVNAPPSSPTPLPPNQMQAREAYARAELERLAKNG